MYLHSQLYQGSTSPFSSIYWPARCVNTLKSCNSVTALTSRPIFIEECPGQQALGPLSARLSPFSEKVQLCSRKSGGHSVDFDSVLLQLLSKRDCVRIGSCFGSIVCNNVESGIWSCLDGVGGHIGSDVEDDGLRRGAQEGQDRCGGLDETDQVHFNAGLNDRHVDGGGVLILVEFGYT